MSSSQINHKHCVFCGQSSDVGMLECHAQGNYLAMDTVGNKPHAYPADNRELARAAVTNNKKVGFDDITFIAGGENYE